jgi:transposase
VEAGATPHLAEPVETSALRGNKRRAKTDREDARWLRTPLCEGRPPEAWIPPAHVREWRTRARLRKTLVDERTTWLQRVQATLFHHGIAGAPDKPPSPEGRAFLDALELPDAARERIGVALGMIEALDGPLAPIERELRQLARRQTGCRAPMAHYGIGELTAPTILCELGDVTRLSASRTAVRCAGLERRGAPLRPPLAGRQTDQTTIAAAALGTLRVGPSGPPAHQPRPRRLPGAQGARALAHPSVADHGPQARPALLPHPPRARPRRIGAPRLNPPPTRSAQAHHSQMTPSLPARSHSYRDSRPPAAVHQRPSGRSRPPRIDPSTITSPATRPSTQISPGARGTIGPTATRLHNHPPPT